MRTPAVETTGVPTRHDVIERGKATKCLLRCQCILVPLPLLVLSLPQTPTQERDATIGMLDLVDASCPHLEVVLGVETLRQTSSLANAGNESGLTDNHSFDSVDVATGYVYRVVV
jgi:hypothetical protein